MELFTTIALGLGSLLALSLLSAGIVRIRPKEKGVVERFGKYRGIKDDGIHFVIPFVDQVYRVNVTEQLADVDTTEMITKDNLNVDVDAQVYYKVRRKEKDLKKAMYEVDDYDYQIIQLAQTTARSVIGDMKFEKVNNDRNTLNEKLQKELEQQTDEWGINVVRVELQEITPPEKVQQSMNEIVEAENKKDAADDKREEKKILAQGEKEAAIEEAKGKKQAAILEATGNAQAIELEAEAQANQIKVVNSSLNEYFVDQAQTFKQLEVAENGLKHNSKFFFDQDSDMTNVFTESMANVTPIDDDKWDSEKAEGMDFGGVGDVKEQIEEAQKKVEESAKEKTE